MSMDFSIRPVGAPAVASAAGVTPEATKAAVPTQLPADKVVTATAAAQSAYSDPQLDGEQSHQVVIDRAAAEVVYRVVDNRTNLVLRQFPDDARLRSRAYLRAQDEEKNERAENKTDLRI